MTYTETEALAAISALNLANKLWLSDHALYDTMPRRKVRRGDVWYAIAGATSCEDQHDGTWKIEGLTKDEETLVVIVAIEEDRLVIVTTF